jgi:hypothetical protein
MLINLKNPIDLLDETISDLNVNVTINHIHCKFEAIEYLKEKNIKSLTGKLF